MAAATGIYERDPVKVVIINTQYVETDAMSFKSVVQMLTGKDSKIQIDPSSSPASSTKYYSSSSAAGDFYSDQDDLRLLNHHQQQPCGLASVAATNGPVMCRGLSFKDFEKMLKELPPLDELFRLC